jgi:hypothetical protein
MPPAFFCFSFFFLGRVLHFCLSNLDHSPLTYASLVAGIIGLCLYHLLREASLISPDGHVVPYSGLSRWIAAPQL